MAKYCCPQCGETDKLQVNVLTSAKLIQYEGNFETEINGDHEWDGQSIMWCVCGFSEASSAFECECQDDEEVR